MRIFSMAGVLLVSFSFITSSAIAKSPSLIGSWRGGGVIQPHNGAKEKTRCRANIHKAPTRGHYRASYRCSSPYGVVTQAVTLRRTGANRYTGSFRNTQHNISGSISVILRGNSHNVTMRSPKGRGWINMKKH